MSVSRVLPVPAVHFPAIMSDVNCDLISLNQIRCRRTSLRWWSPLPAGDFGVALFARNTSLHWMVNEQIGTRSSSRRLSWALRGYPKRILLRTFINLTSSLHLYESGASPTTLATASVYGFRRPPMVVSATMLQRCHHFRSLTENTPWLHFLMCRVQPRLAVC